MTAILRIQKINFADRRESSGVKRGIHNGGLVAIKKHNERQELNHLMEMKSKRATHIDTTQSHRNHYFKTMQYQDIQSLKAKAHRNNSVGAFEVVFDFQDLDESERKQFDVMEHKMMIDEFLASQEIGQTYELLSYAYHGDEKNPHFHLVFSGWNENEQTFNFNDVFNPKRQGEPVLDADGNHVYMKHNRGKLKGQYMLDEDGAKIPKFETVRENGTQKLQDDWGAYLQERGNRYQHKKSFSSMLHFSKTLWRILDETTKERVYLIRELERERMRAIKENNEHYLNEVEILLKNEFFTVMNIVSDIQTAQVIQQGKKRQKTLKYRQNL